MLPDSTLDGLVRLARECTARITPVGREHPAGTGFFIDTDLLVTCHHVVADGLAEGEYEVQVAPFGGAERLTGTVLDPPEDREIDVALVRVPPPGEGESRPTVLLHREVSGEHFHLVGYPREDYHVDEGPGLESISATGHTRVFPDSRRVQLIRLTDTQIKPGLSGGLVLSARSGAVVGVAEYTEAQDAALGGGAIPIDRIADQFPEVRERVIKPPAATTAWQDQLGRVAWEALGFAWDPATQFDIFLSGNRSQWSVGLAPGGDDAKLRIFDLGEEIGEILLGWARNSGRREKSEVQLLGRLLSAALFPDPVAKHFPPPARTGEEPVLVRLHVDASGPLAALPWEFVTVPGRKNQFLAAHDGYAFVRVDDDLPIRQPEEDDRDDVDPGPVKPSVLSIVVQPEETHRLATLVVNTQLETWPKEEHVSHSVETILSQAGFEVESRVNPRLTGLRDAANRHYDVVHYAGFAHTEVLGDDRSMEYHYVACSDGRDDIIYHRVVEEIAELVQSCSPQLLVLEFGLPPLDADHRQEPISPSVVEELRTSGVEAIVCTRPVHPSQSEQFNTFFYKLLGEGHTVEHAAQKGRDNLMRTPLVDYAGFGWFTLVTGPRPRMRLLDAPLTVTEFEERRGRPARTVQTGGNRGPLR